MAHLGDTIINGSLRVIGGQNVDTINGVTVGASPKFTDTNNAVAQTATSGSANYEVLFSGTADNTTRTEGARKNSNLTFNPSTGVITTTKFSGKFVNQLITGTGTAATTSGSNYIPAKWTFNTGVNASDGDIITIKIPVAGHSYGVFISINNGTNYYPVAALGTSRLTTHYGVNTYISLVFETAGSVADIFPVAGAATRTTVTGGCWRVINFYDSNTTYNFSGTTFYSGNSSTAEHAANNIVKNGNYYYTSNGPTQAIGASSDDGAIYAQSYSDTWVGQIAQDYRNGNLFTRGKNNGTWSAWHSIPTGGIIAGARYGGTGNTTKIKININSTLGWMMSFVVNLYQGYRATKVMISGYQYGSNHWHQPEAVLLGDSDYTNLNVYFGYDGTNQLWVGFDGGSYTGVSVSDVCNGYTQIEDYGKLFTISNVSSLTTLQTTVALQGIKFELVN